MKSQSNNLKGSAFVLLSAVFFGSYGIWSKLMADGFDIFLQSWIRGVVVVGILLPIGFLTKSFQLPMLKDLKWFAIITIPGSLVFPFFYYGFINLPMGTSTILFYSALTLTAYALGIFFFREKLTWEKIASLILGLTGLATIFSFSIDKALLIPALVTFFAGICGGIEVVFTKKLSDKYSPIQLTTALYSVDIGLNFALFAIFEGLNLDVSAGTVEWIGLVMYSLAGLFSFTFVTLGYKYVEPSIGGVVGLLEIVFSVVFGAVFFAEGVSWVTLLGGGLIICAAALPNLAGLIALQKKE